MLKMLILAAIVAGCGGSGGGDDGAMPDATNPHMLVPCMMGSATLCEQACAMPGPSTGDGCGEALDQFMNSGTCMTTFTDSNGRQGCCLQVDISGNNTAFSMRLFECI